MNYLNRQTNKHGMIMIMVVGILVFVMAIFAGLVSRVRHETSVTMRVSLSERLYQISSAVGRLAVRKLQKDFETRDQDNSKKILDAAFAGKTGPLNEEDYTDVVKNLDVVKEIITRFKSKWGPVAFTVKYISDLGRANSFRAPITGLKSSPYERKGHIDVIVTVEHRGVTKTCRIRKEFLLVNLLAQPFHRFTLFSHKGATIDYKRANNTLIKDDGQLIQNKPFLCFNKLIRNKKKGQDGLDFRKNSANNIVKPVGTDSEPSFVRSGWIYLGGRGASTDSKGNSGNLILNVNTGSKDDGGIKAFGEFFHFYFNPDSAGWLISRDWTNWLDSQIPGNALGGKVSQVMLSFVDYGYYKGLWKIDFDRKYLFKIAKEIYEKSKGIDLDWGSSMHLFGTPALCTPTLIFGSVKRRYARTFAFYFPQQQRVFPLRAFTSPLSLRQFGTKQIVDWYNLVWGSSADVAFISDFSSLFDTGPLNVGKYQQGFPSNSPPLSGIDPEIRDWEPYMEGLKNICDPGGPDRKWSSVIPRTQGGYVKDGPEKLCKPDYRFTDDKEIYYTGSIKQLKIDKKYLRDRMTYYVNEDGKSEYRLSKCDFFKNNFITKVKGKNNLFLNQIIGFKGDVIIDIPLEVIKGGIILCDGKITVQSAITNPYISKPPTTPDAFGYLTLIAAKGIAINAGSSATSGGLPQTHGFFISMNNGGGHITVANPIHIIGGVACDNIAELVEKECTLEWGFEPLDLANDKCFSCRDYYGFSMGPRDVEIISEE